MIRNFAVDSWRFSTAKTPWRYSNKYILEMIFKEKTWFSWTCFWPLGCRYAQTSGPPLSPWHVSGPAPPPQIILSGNYYLFLVSWTTCKSCAELSAASLPIDKRNQRPKKIFWSSSTTWCVAKAWNDAVSTNRLKIFRRQTSRSDVFIELKSRICDHNRDVIIQFPRAIKIRVLDNFYDSFPLSIVGDGPRIWLLINPIYHLFFLTFLMWPAWTDHCRGLLASATQWFAVITMRGVVIVPPHKNGPINWTCHGMRPFSAVLPTLFFYIDF
jgi:hypothetical protein